MPIQLFIEGQAPKYLTAPSYTLGRAAECDVLLPENDALVSRNHARIERAASGTWWLLDLGSTNGTFLNGEKLTQKHVLQDGDQIGIGRTQIAFQDTSPQAMSTPAAPPSRAAATAFVSTADVQTALETHSAPVPLPPSSPLNAPIAIKENEIATASQTPTIHSTRGEASTSLTMEPAASPDLPAVPTESLQINSPLVDKTSDTETDIAPSDVTEAAPRLDATEVLTPQTTLPDSLPENIAPISLESHSPKQMSAAPTPGYGNVVSDVKPPDDDVTKQCTRCRTMYSSAETACPSCGHEGFKAKSAAAANTVATVAAPTAAVPTFPSVPRREATPFDAVPASPVPPVPPMPSPTPVRLHSAPVPNQPHQPQVSHVVHHVATPVKSSGLALVLSLVLMGAGQIYNGQVGKGICFFFTGFFMFLISLIPFIGWLMWLPLISLHIWNIIDAHKTAERINAQAAQAAPRLPL